MAQGPEEEVEELFGPKGRGTQGEKPLLETLPRGDATEEEMPPPLKESPSSSEARRTNLRQSFSPLKLKPSSTQNEIDPSLIGQGIKGTKLSADARKLTWMYSDSLSLSLSSDGIQGRRLSTSFTYIWCLIGCAIGVGDFETFPLLCYSLGGVSFVALFVVAVVIVVLPVITLEIGLAMVTEGGHLRAFAAMGRKCEAAGLLGMSALSFGLVHPLYISYGSKYLIHSFDHPLPWKTSEKAVRLCAELSQALCEKTYDFCHWLDGPKCHVHSFRSVMDFFHDECYAWFADDDARVGFVGFSLYNFFVIFIGWALVYLILTLGYNLMGMLLCVSVMVASIFLIGLLVVGLPLPGAETGLEQFLLGSHVDCNETSRLLPRPWLAAMQHSLLSLAPATGVYTAFGRHAEPGRNIVFDSALVATVDLTFSILAGLSTFSVVGFLSRTLNKPTCEMPISGLGLAFFTYPTGVATLPGRLANVVSAVVSIIICFPSLYNAITLCEACVVVICESKVGSIYHFKRWPVIMSFCLLCYFGSGFFLSSNLGYAFARVLTSISAGVSQTIGLGAESFAAGWIYLNHHVIEHVGARAYWTHCATYLLGCVAVAVLVLIGQSTIVAICVGVSFTFFGFMTALYLAGLSDPAMPIKERVYYLSVFSLEPLRRLLNKRCCPDARVFRLTFMWSICLKYVSPAAAICLTIAGRAGLYNTDGTRNDVTKQQWYVHLICLIIPLTLIVFGVLAFAVKPSILTPCLPLRGINQPIIAEDYVQEVQFHYAEGIPAP